MRVVYIKDNLTNDITELVAQMTWSGNESEIARRLELEVLNPLQDYYIPKIELQLGGFIILNSDNEKELFQGFILSKEKNSQNGNLSLVCVDALFYANKSKSIHNFSKKTAEEIGATLCNEAKIAIGCLTPTGIAQNFPANDTVFKIIKDAYDYASSLNGKKYKINMIQGKIYVEEKSKTANLLVLTSENDLNGSSYNETFENMINVIKVYDDTGKQIGEAKNTDNIKTYGVFQDVYEKEEGKNFNIVANNLLKGIEKTLSVDAVGNLDCITGNYVSIIDNIIGVDDDYEIISDSHVFSNGTHSMHLELREVS